MTQRLCFGRCPDAPAPFCHYGKQLPISLSDAILIYHTPSIGTNDFLIKLFLDEPLVSRGLAKDLLFAVGIERLTDYIYDFLVEYFTTDHLTGPEVIEKYFGFLSNSARSRLVGHPHPRGEKGWNSLGLIWRMMVDIVRGHPVFNDFFGSDLDPLLEYFGLITTA